MTAPEPQELRLTDFMDLPTLQEIQDSFAAVANVKVTITDAAGGLLTAPDPTRDFLRRQAVIAESTDAEGPFRQGREYVAPIMVNNQRLATIRMVPESPGVNLDEAKLGTLAERFGLDLKQVRGLAAQLLRTRSGARPAAIQFLFLLANAIARLCFQEYQLRQRVAELTAVYDLTMILSDARELDVILQRTVEEVVQIMNVKAASIRLVDEEKDELIIKAVANLSEQYLAKGPVPFSKTVVDRTALGPRGYEYVKNMGTDERVLYPQDAAREGIVSALSAGMRYKGKAVGVLRIYTDHEEVFTQLRIDMLRAIATQAAAAIENARLLQESLESERLEKQVQMAAEVQQRMIPRTPPKSANVDLAAVYEPCFELGGDLYDFIPLPDGNIGMVVADVAGKGVPASLIMASVRAFLRADVDRVYYLYEIIRRINEMLCRDTKPSEFVTLFYAVLDTHNRRLSYCNAGHPPAMLLREGKLIELSSENMVLGVDPDQPYQQAIIDLVPGDTLLLYTDGVVDAMNFQGETFGRQRLISAFTRGGPTAETVAQNILWDVRRFVGLARATDDITMIVAKIK